jgi:CRP/FNR family cyclic AMP-dependent transcriptional regulator
MLANADVRLGIRKNARRRDGAAKRRLDRTAQRWFSPRNTSAKMTLLDRFRGEGGRRLCVEALAAQRLVSGNRELAEDLADRAEVLAVPAGQTLISQGAEDNDIYFILAGTFDVVVSGRRVAGRSAGDHVGEMAAVQPAQKRSATVTALEDAIVAKLSAEVFSNLGSRYPQLYRLIAQELARRVLQLESRSIE